jgi:hypothetical protein
MKHFYKILLLFCGFSSFAQLGASESKALKVADEKLAAAVLCDTNMTVPVTFYDDYQFLFLSVYCPMPKLPKDRLTLWRPSNSRFCVMPEGGSGSFLKTAPGGDLMWTMLTKSDVGLSNADNTSDLNKPISNAQAAVNATKFNNPTGTSTQYLDGTGTPKNFTSATRTFNNNVSRSLNTNYTISTTRDSQVSYSIALSVTNPLLAGSSTASVFLEYSTDGGTNWITVSQGVNASSVALTVTVQISQPNTQVLSGVIPANALVRLRSTTAGTATATYTRGQEVLL